MLMCTGNSEGLCLRECRGMSGDKAGVVGGRQTLLCCEKALDSSG